MLRFLLVLLFVVCALPAEAKFTTSKYYDAQKLLVEKDFRTDLDWINYRMQNDYGPKLVKEFAEKLKAQKPSMHPDDVQRAAEARRDSFFQQITEQIGKQTKPTRDNELMAIIDAFEDADTERLKNFFDAYAPMTRLMLDYDHIRALGGDIHAIYSPDHRQKWDIAADISQQLLKTKPAFITFADEKAQNVFTNNMVNHLTNNFTVKQLETIKNFLGQNMAQKYLTLVNGLFTARYEAIDALYKNAYPAFAQPEQEKKSDKEFQ